MARLMLVANPAASQFTGGDHRLILSLLGRRHMVEAVWPRSAEDSRTLAADAVTAGFDGVVAMGGDGIVHHVAQALVGTEVFVGVIPAGTTNVFARQIGLLPASSKAARHLAADPKITEHPVVTLEATRADGTTTVHHAVFAVGIGVDADVVAAAETEPYRKYRFGAVHYARTSLRLLWSDIRRRPPTLTVVEGARRGQAVAVMTQFHRAFTYFGRRPLAFEADRPDPMTLLVIGKMRFRSLPSLLRRIALGGSLANVADMDVWPQVNGYEVRAAEPARFQLDGELLGELVSATVTYRPAALWVAGPAVPTWWERLGQWREGRAASRREADEN